jgi:hypothetical protein
MIQYNLGEPGTRANHTILLDLCDTIRNKVEEEVYILFPDGTRRKFRIEEWVSLYETNSEVQTSCGNNNPHPEHFFGEHFEEWCAGR